MRDGPVYRPLQAMIRACSRTYGDDPLRSLWLACSTPGGARPTRLWRLASNESLDMDVANAGVGESASNAHG